MPSPFTIIQGKESQQPKKSLFLVTIVAPDGDTSYLTTSGYYGAPSLAYNGNTYQARIQKNDIEQIQASGPQGFDSLSGFTLTIADADKEYWIGHCINHGWRGSSVTLTIILWDVVANAYSTDAMQWSFIGGNPQHSHAQGQTTIDVASAINFTRLKVPSIPIQGRCPWDFPTTAAQRSSARYDPTSVYYQCGYSADISGGIGNLTGGGVAFTTCDLTRSSPTDPSVGCMARLGKASATNVAPDGDLTHDIAGHYTARFGGITWVAPSQFSGRAYISGQKTFGFNQPNISVIGSFYNWVYGTQWVSAQVLAPAGDPNSLRSEVSVCVAAFGAANVLQLVVNGVEVPYNNTSDALFTWHYINQGGRSGALNGDAYYSNTGHSGLGDPHGSVCVVEFVVPAQLATPGSVPTCQALVTSGPILNCYAITSVTSGVMTFAGPNWSLVSGSNFVTVVGNSNPALNALFQISAYASGNPGTATLSGSSDSGTGGAVFFYQNPDLYDTGGSIASNPTGNYANLAEPAANLAFAALDLLTWGNITLSQIEPTSWYTAAQICATPLSYIAANGSSQTHAQFKASFALPGGQQQTLAHVLTGVRNSGNLMIAPNSNTGLIQCFVRQTLADQQGAPVSGSNYNTAVASVTAAGVVTNGYYAYAFDATNIDKSSFKITTTRFEATPNTVAFSFQDENNGYTVDSLTEIDPTAYLYSGNQEVNVPVPISAIPNFDQGTRVANVQLAEALYGNPRDDQGGTLFFEFTCNQRVLHLAGRMGYICSLSWPECGIGATTPQAVRIISLKPDTDGEHWAVKCAWHNDEWYEYAYGQNPAPFIINPLLAPRTGPPYPWRPGIATWGSSDALFPGKNSFSFSVDTTQYPAVVGVNGCVPVNAQSSGFPPVAPAQASTANTGGSITPGTWYFKFSSNGQLGPISSTIMAVVPTGTNTNTITVSGLQWQSGAAPAIQPFVGKHSLAMYEAASATYTGSSPDANGNPTVYTFTAISTDGLGLPDVNFREFLVEETGIVHGGVFGDGVYAVNTAGGITSSSLGSGGLGYIVGDGFQVAGGTGAAGTVLTVNGSGTVLTYILTSIGTGYTSGTLSTLYGSGTGLTLSATATSTGTILNFPEVTWTSNQWQDYVLSLYYRPGATVQPGLNLTVSSSTVNTLTLSATGFLPGDVVVMRFKSSSITSLTIGDPNLVNWYAPSGLDINEDAGNLIRIICGTGSSQSPKLIASNTATVYTLAQPWDITPDATSVFIVTSPTVAYSYTTNPFSSTNGTVSQLIANTPAIVTAAEQSLLVVVATADVNGLTGPLQYQPFREVYVPAQSVLSSAATLTVSGTLAIGSDLAPRVALASALVPVDVTALVKIPPTGAGLTCDVSYYTGSAWTVWMTLIIPATLSSISATSAQLLAAATTPIPAGAPIRLDVTGTGTTFPGSDLSVMIYF